MNPDTPGGEKFGPFVLFPDPNPPRTDEEKRRRIDENNARDLSMAAKSGVIHWARVMTQGDARTCEACRELESQTFAIEALAQHPVLPCVTCTGVVNGQPGWCRCTYLFFHECPDDDDP